MQQTAPLKAVVCASYALAVLPNPSTPGGITHWDFLANGGGHLVVDTQMLAPKSHPAISAPSVVNRDGHLRDTTRFLGLISQGLG